MVLVLFCAGQRITNSWTNRNNSVNQVRSAKGNVPGNIVSCGIPVGVVIARPVSLLFKSQNLFITNPSGWSLLDARDNPLGICSPVNQPTRLNSPGKSFWLMPSCFPCSHPLGWPFPPGFCLPFAIEQESGAGKHQLRFIVCVSHSVFFGYPLRL